MEASLWKNILLKWIWNCRFVLPLPKCLEEVEPEDMFPAYKEGIVRDTTHTLDSFESLIDFLSKTFPNFTPEIGHNGRIVVRDYVFVYTLMWRFACDIMNRDCPPGPSTDYSVTIPHLLSLTREKLSQFIECMDSGKPLRQIKELLESKSPKSFLMDDTNPVVNHSQSSDQEDIESTQSKKKYAYRHESASLTWPINPHIYEITSSYSEALESTDNASFDEAARDFPSGRTSVDSSSRYQDDSASGIDLKSEMTNGQVDKDKLIEVLKDHTRTLENKNEDLSKKLKLLKVRIFGLESRHHQLMDDVNIQCEGLDTEQKLSRFKDKLLQQIRIDNSNLSEDALMLLLSQIEHSMDQMSVDLSSYNWMEQGAGNNELDEQKTSSTLNSEQGDEYETKQYQDILEQKLEYCMVQLKILEIFDFQMLELLSYCNNITIETGKDAENLFKQLSLQLVYFMANYRYMESASKEFHQIVTEKGVDTQKTKIGELLQSVADNYNPSVGGKPTEQNAIKLLHEVLDKFFVEHKSLLATTTYLTREYRICLVKCDRQQCLLQQQKANRIKMDQHIKTLQEQLEYKASESDWFEIELKLQMQKFQQLEPDLSLPRKPRGDHQHIGVLLMLLKDKLIGHVSSILRLKIQIDVPSIIDAQMITVHSQRLSCFAENLKNQLMGQIAYISRLMAEFRLPEQMDYPLGEDQMLMLLDRLQQQVNAVEDNNLHLKMELDTLTASRCGNIELRQKLRQTRDELYDMKNEQLRLKHQLLVNRSDAHSEQLYVQLQNYREYAGELEQQLSAALTLVNERNIEFSELVQPFSELKRSMGMEKDQMISHFNLDWAQLQAQVQTIGQLLAARQEVFCRQQIELQLLQERNAAIRNRSEKEIEQQLSEAQLEQQRMAKKLKKYQDTVEDSRLELEQIQCHESKLLDKLDAALVRLNEANCANSKVGKEILGNQGQLPQLQKKPTQHEKNLLEEPSLDKHEVNRLKFFKLHDSTMHRDGPAKAGSQKLKPENQAELQEQKANDIGSPTAQSSLEHELSIARQDILEYKNEKKQMAEKLITCEERIAHLEKQLADVHMEQTAMDNMEKRRLVRDLENARKHMREQDDAQLILSQKLSTYKIRIEQMMEHQERILSEKSTLEKALLSAEKTNEKLCEQRLELITKLSLASKETKQSQLQLNDLQHLQLLLLKKFENVEYQLDKTKSDLLQSEQMQRKAMMELVRLQKYLEKPYEQLDKAEEQLAVLETYFQGQSELQLELDTLKTQLKELQVQKSQMQLMEEKRERVENEFQSKRQLKDWEQLPQWTYLGHSKWASKSIEDELAQVRYDNQCLRRDVKAYKELARRCEQEVNEFRERHSHSMLEYAAAINHIRRIDEAYEMSESRMHQLESEMAVSFSQMYMLHSELDEEYKPQQQEQEQEQQQEQEQEQQQEQEQEQEQQKQQQQIVSDSGSLTDPDDQAMSEISAKNEATLHLRQNAIIGQLRQLISKLQAESNAIALREYNSRRKQQMLVLELAKCNSDLNDMRCTNEELLQEREHHIERLTEMQRNAQLQEQNEDRSQQSSELCQTVLSIDPNAVGRRFLDICHSSD